VKNMTDHPHSSAQLVAQTATPAATVAGATVRVGPLRINVVDHDAAVGLLLRDAAAERSCVVVTPNIHHLRLARSDAGFRAALDRAEHVLADGWPLIAASQILRPPLPGRIAGIDLVDEILQTAEPRLRVALLGGPPGAALRLADVISHHRVVYVNDLPWGRWDTPDALAAITAGLAEARPTLTLVGIGAPRQELLADRLRGAVCGPIVCCGAAIEILAGHTPRAPAALRAAGLEWAFRLAREPRRLGPRYMAGSMSFTATVVSELAQRCARREI
jgi:N-acetylglucosaminyldiphosphoundecaprenol N-acetyl-beta-D-mannosaminyltransferase